MNRLAPAQIAALRQLRELWRGLDFCLIGATALGCHLPLPRPTNDLDITLSVSLNSFPGGLDKLSGWRQHPTKEHEWHGPDDVQVDVVPAGEDLIAQGAVTWPRTGHSMSLIGMRLAFATALPLFVAEGLSIPVAKLHVLALLKMVSYLDRPEQRQRDLEDLAYVLENYVSTYDERIFADDVPERIEIFRRPAFLLGLDLGPALNAVERGAIERFVALGGGFGADTTRSRLLRVAPRRWRSSDDPEAELDAILEAFQTGLAPIPSGTAKSES